MDISLTKFELIKLLSKLNVDSDDKLNITLGILAGAKEVNSEAEAEELTKAMDDSSGTSVDDLLRLADWDRMCFSMVIHFAEKIEPDMLKRLAEIVSEQRGASKFVHAGDLSVHLDHKGGEGFSHPN